VVWAVVAVVVVLEEEVVVLVVGAMALRKAAVAEAVRSTSPTSVPPSACYLLTA